MLLFILNDSLLFALKTKSLKSVVPIKLMEGSVPEFPVIFQSFPSVVVNFFHSVPFQ